LAAISLIYGIVIEQIVFLCIALAAWLNLHVGISRQNAGIFLKALQLIISTTINLIFGILHQAGFEILAPIIDIPTDIQTVYKEYKLEPEIIRTPCCPTCYKPYSLEDLPDVCNWRKSPRSWPCGTELKKQVHFHDKKTKARKTKMVPKCSYATQSFESWLRFFLARPQIEEHLERSFQQEQIRQTSPQANIMRDVQDSPAWRGLGNFLRTRYHLVWAFYIDWFNPFTMKIAGTIQYLCL
jgi:hypothetical protein